MESVLANTEVEGFMGDSNSLDLDPNTRKRLMLRINKVTVPSNRLLGTVTLFHSQHNARSKKG